MGLKFHVLFHVCLTMPGNSLPWISANSTQCVPGWKSPLNFLNAVLSFRMCEVAPVHHQAFGPDVLSLLRFCVVITHPEDIGVVALCVAALLRGCARFIIPLSSPASRLSMGVASTVTARGASAFTGTFTPKGDFVYWTLAYTPQHNRKYPADSATKTNSKIEQSTAVPGDMLVLRCSFNPTAVWFWFDS